MNDMAKIVKRLLACGFVCEAGPLELSEDFRKLVNKSDLWIVVKNGANICHTSGKGGWRFTACTNKEEAEWLADLYNKERYEGNKICSVIRLLEAE